MLKFVWGSNWYRIGFAACQGDFVAALVWVLGGFESD